MNTLPTILDLGTIIPGHNDRTQFSEEQIKKLAENIRSTGRLLNPLTVRPLEGPELLYEIIAGERRFRACSRLGWKEIPAYIVDFSDEEASRAMLAENMSRQDLDPIDEAEAYTKRIQTFGWTTEQCAAAAGVTTVRVLFRLKLLHLREDIRFLVRTGAVSLGYAQVLADANLNKGFQLLALKSLRDNPHPSPSWFRNIVAAFAEKQNQGVLFGDPLFGGVACEAPPCQYRQPPDPHHDKAPALGTTIKEKLHSQAAFWHTAAEQWAQQGKPFKRQECQAAASALTAALDTL